MSMLARIVEAPSGAEGVELALIEGEIDASNTAEIASGLRALVANHSTALVVDLTATTYLDSAAINVLFALGGDLLQRQQRLLLVVPEHSPIARALSITGLDTAMPVHPTRELALARAAG